MFLSCNIKVLHFKFRSIAQLVQQRNSYKVEVMSSNLIAPTKIGKQFSWLERYTDNVEVLSSNLNVPTIWPDSEIKKITVVNILKAICSQDVQLLRGKHVNILELKIEGSSPSPATNSPKWCNWQPRLFQKQMEKSVTVRVRSWAQNNKVYESIRIE